MFRRGCRGLVLLSIPEAFKGGKLIFDKLREIQRKHGYLAADPLQALSKQLNVPLYQINGVAEFYPEFHLAPPAKFHIEVCRDMVCHLRGADRLTADLRQRFMPMGKRVVDVHERSCLGQCDAAPALTINEAVFRDATSEQTEILVRASMAGLDAPPHVPAHLPVELKADPYVNTEKYGALRELVKTRDWEGVISSLKEAALGGMGGAGFPTSIKWDVVKKTPGDPKYIVCNADESEPGTIKDRFIMTHAPHLVVEGVIIGALVTGARTGYIYLRHEYREQEAILREELEYCRKEKLLGDGILGTELSFHLEMFISPGGYICGEGSAQLEAIEGKRAEPRNRPPNSATHGLWMKPTVLNNVETFANVPQILTRGVQWYRSQGHHEAASGLKFVGISGDIQRPGVYEIPMGLPLSEVVYGLAGGPPDGRKVKAFAPSGAASGYQPASKLDTRLDFKSMAAAGTMLGSGAIVILDETRCILDMALNTVTFFRNESCGKCVPCRMGSAKMADMLAGWTRGKGQESDFELIADLSETMKQTSICGLGQFVPYPILTALQNFREEIEAHVLHRKCPAGVCPMRGDEVTR
ncbi:MAG TPA: NADH-ubiquinone oxidoreductase-F iron-sulfur binding region domain-containing protein [Bryobacteraceae bacterium]|nr:NADH-ubiquinone oxidoreductase-F iron-sulfur binding region domain-containing protein [Bryobacteraceae bacterium]